MFKLITFIALLKLLLILGDTIDDTVSLHFEDNLIDGKLSSFTKSNIRLSRQSNAQLLPSRTISSSQYERLIEGFQSNTHSYYTLKVNFKHNSIQDYVMTSIPMCLVLQAQFQYTMNLFVNENGYIVSVHVLTNDSTCSFSNISRLETKNEIISRVPLHLQFSDVGPQPEIQHFLDKIKREKEAKLNAQENDNRPFILKYWKYWLPIVIILVVQSAFTDGGR